VLRSATMASRRRRSAAETEMEIPLRMPQTRIRRGDRTSSVSATTTRVDPSRRYEQLRRKNN
jgi:hypothetical protein